MAEDPTVEQPADPCGECGYPLAPDQRYCLNCGRRRSEPRVDFAPLLQAEPTRRAEPVAPAAVAPEPAVAAREPSPVIAVAGIALLGLMLLVGVLIGRGDGDTETAATPTVVEVGGGSTEVADAAGTGGGEAAGGGATKDVAAAKKSGGGGGGSEAKGGGGSSDADVAGSTSNPEVVDPAQLDAIENATGEEQQEASENLPDTIQLPGEPPPVDNEEPGGGTSATVIK